MANEQDQLTTADCVIPSASTTNSARPENSSSAEQIRQEIAHTRSEMDQTLDALGERLRPVHLLEDVVNAFRPSSWRRGESSAAVWKARKPKEPKQVDTGGIMRATKSLISEHPLSAALIGAGLAWMIYEEVRGDNTQKSKAKSWLGYFRSADESCETGVTYDATASWRRSQSAQTYDESMGQDLSRPGVVDRAKEKVGQVAQRARHATTAATDKVTHAWDATRESIAGAASTASGAMRTVGESARQGWGQVRNAGEKAQEQMTQGYRYSKDSLEQAMDQYPLSIAAAAAALGVLSGLLLPGTEPEGRLMGERAQRVKEQVKNAGRTALERGKELAASTADAAAGAAQQQGLTAASLIDKAKNVVSEVGRCVTETAQREGLGASELGEKVKQVANEAQGAARDEAQRAVGDVKQALKQ